MSFCCHHPTLTDGFCQSARVCSFRETTIGYDWARALFFISDDDDLLQREGEGAELELQKGHQKCIGKGATITHSS